MGLDPRLKRAGLVMGIEAVNPNQSLSQNLSQNLSQGLRLSPSVGAGLGPELGWTVES